MLTPLRHSLTGRSCAGTIDFNELSSIISARRGGPDVVRTLPVEDATITYNQFLVRSPHNPAQWQRGAAHARFGTAVYRRWQTAQTSSVSPCCDSARIAPPARSLVVDGLVWPARMRSGLLRSHCRSARRVAPIYFGPSCRVVQQFAEKLEMFSPQVGLSVLYGYTAGYSQSTLRPLRQISSPQVFVGYPMGVLSAAHVSTHSTPCEYSE